MEKKNIPYDKRLHMLAGLLIGVIGTVITPYTFVGILAAFIAGIAKELYDQYSYGGFDIDDAIATWIGGAVGSAIGLLFVII